MNGAHHGSINVAQKERREAALLSTLTEFEVNKQCVDNEER